MVVLKVEYCIYNTLGKLWPFFSTISKNLEKEWGLRFPILLNELCNNSIIEIKDLQKAKKEIITIIKEIAEIQFRELCLDYDAKKEIKIVNVCDLLNYFYDERSKRNLFNTFELAINDAIKFQVPLKIEIIDEINTITVIEEKKKS
jgi:hypothetical protein